MQRIEIENDILRDITMQQAKEDVSYWLKAKRESTLEGIRCLEDAAKQVIVLTSILQGIYFAAVSLSDIKNDNTMWFFLFIINSIIILCFWMLSLYFATRVFLPEKYLEYDNGGDLQKQLYNIQEIFLGIIKYKYNALHRAFALLWLSFPFLALNILVFLIFLIGKSTGNAPGVG